MACDMDCIISEIGWLCAELSWCRARTSAVGDVLLALQHDALAVPVGEPAEVVVPHLVTTAHNW